MINLQKIEKYIFVVKENFKDYYLVSSTANNVGDETSEITSAYREGY